MIGFIDGFLATVVSAFAFLLCLELLLALIFVDKLPVKQLQDVERTNHDKNEDDYPVSLTSDKTRLRTVVLIPAHNESSDIGNTLAQLKQELQTCDQVLVVADNCDDNTAQISQSHGALVLQRHSSQERGKGYALDFGVKWALEHLNFSCLVVFDADCRFAKGSLFRLAEVTIASQKVHQASYLMKAPDSRAKNKIAEFTWWIKNAARATGLSKLKIGCHIQGSGMAFPRHILSTINFASASIVEDLELGLSLSLQKHYIEYFPASVVESFFPSNDKGLTQQRERWEHGHLDTVFKFPSFLKRAVKNKSPKAVLLASDAAIPPLFGFIALLCCAVILGGLASYYANYYLLVSSACGLFFLSILLVLLWCLRASHIISIQDLAGMSSFVKDKLSVYTGFFTKKQTTWVRTTRDNHENEKNSD